MLQRAQAAATVFLAAAALGAQTVASLPAAQTHATENARAVTGVRIRALPDGSVWFMVPSNDRIVLLKDDTLTQWQIRDDKKIGANPVDFELDGDVIWFTCNGESLIDAGKSIFARLDTKTGALREWVVPGAKPAGFWRAPDGRVWLPQSDGRLQSLDLNTLQVVDYKSRSADGKILTFAYSALAHGADGALWMTDFGNNRIVRYEPGADTETSWTFFNPSVARLNPSQVQFDDFGNLWISQRAGARMDSFSPANNILVSYGGTASAIHFDIFRGRIYVAQASGLLGAVAVLDPLIATPSATVLAPQTVPVKHIVNLKLALIRDSTIKPTTFASPAIELASTALTVSSGLAGTGVLRTQFNNRNAYGIAVSGGYVWTGSDGKLVRLVLQNFGTDDDLAIPVVFENTAADPTATDEDRVNVTLANRGDSTITGDLQFLYSPGALAASIGFSVNPQSTAVLENVFHNVLPAGIGAKGPVRIHVTAGNAGDLSASARSWHARVADGAGFGSSLPAASTAGSFGLGDQITLFTTGRDAETATLGLYTSSSGAGSQGTATLASADGTVRGTLSFNLVNNTLEEFAQPASAFGLAPRTGDTIRINAGSGSLRAYVRVADTGTADTAVALPVKSTWNAVVPYVVNGLGSDGTGPVSDLYLSNSDLQNPASVTITYFASGAPSAPAHAALTLPPGASQIIPDVLRALFGVPAGSGALTIIADRSIANAVRIASRKSDGDYAAFIGAVDGSQSVPPGGSATASGLQETPGVRSTDLALFNGGHATTATVVGFDGNGSEIRRLSVNLAAGESRRLVAVLHSLGLDGPGEIRNARVRVDAPAGSQLYAIFAQTDPVSGDADWTLPQ